MVIVVPHQVNSHRHFASCRYNRTSQAAGRNEDRATVMEQPPLRHPVRGQPLPGDRQARRHRRAPISRARTKRSTASSSIPQGEIQQARQRLSRHRPSSRQAGLRRAAVRPHQQGRRPPVGAVPRRDDREGLLGRRRGRGAAPRRARWKTGCAIDKTAPAKRVEVVEPRTPRGPASAPALPEARPARRADLAGGAARRPAGRTSCACSLPITAIRSTAMRATARSTRSARRSACTPRSLTFLHPIRYEPITLTADVPRTGAAGSPTCLRGHRR